MTMTMRWLRGAVVLLLLSPAVGCSYDDPRVAELPAPGGGSPTHRPGQPCLLCHGFAIAGTIYQRASDGRGVQGAAVAITDAAGHEMVATSNSAGNFYLEVQSGLGAPQAGRQGNLRIPWEPVFPLRIKVSLGGLQKQMRTSVHREGACSICHSLNGAGTDTVSKIFLEDSP